MLDLKRLTYLTALYHHRSYTKASEELFVTQPAISLAVKALERQTGIQLLDRQANGVVFTPEARRQLEKLEALGFGTLPVCVAKTQYSLSDDPTKLGKPEHFAITVRDVKLSAGAGFVVALTGDIMIMPGLPKAPAAMKIDCDNNGKISGLF